MDPLLASTLVIGGFATILGYSFFEERRRDRGRRALAGKLGLRFEVSGLGIKKSLEGALNGFGVEVTWPYENKQTRTRYRIRGLPDFELCAEGFGTSVRKALGGPDQTTGDASLDDEIFLKADELTAAVFLDPEIRKGASALVARGGIIDQGELTLTHPGVDKIEVTEQTLRELGKLACAIRDRRQAMPSLLHEAIEAGWSPTHAMRVLIRIFGRRPETLELCAKVRDAPDPTMQLYAALGLDDDAVVRSLVADPKVADAARLEALERLGRREALDTSWEASLWPLLEHAEAEVRIGAAKVLGTCGTVASVAPLQGLASPLLQDRAVKAAATRAVQQIQARSAGASAGQLALVSPSGSGGELSEAPTAGALSSVQDDTT